jgi:hypothetical protein
MSFRMHSTQDWLQVRDWLAELVYKPGYEFHAVLKGGRITVGLEVMTFNSYRPAHVVTRPMTVFLEPELMGATRTSELIFDRGMSEHFTGGFVIGDLTRLVSTTDLPPNLPELGKESFLKWLRRDVIHVFETHESDEWLKFKGKREPIFDPHRPEPLPIRPGDYSLPSTTQGK